VLGFVSSAAHGAVDFMRDVQPIFQKRCYGCHGQAQQQSNLRLDRRESAMRVIKPGDRAASRLYILVTSAGTLRMPPSGPPLPQADAAVIGKWIEEGAEWTVGAVRKPWSFAPLKRPNPPLVSGTAWKRNEIDAFVLAKLDSKRIKPSPEADPNTLLRRVYLDLTGLPPTTGEVDEYFADRRPGAYERVVDKLLASPHFGEKWSRYWLDLARYADSEGGVQDYGRPFAWRYRDWVINALNQDVPFDRFTIEQIAGDLLPQSTLSQKIATGFHRNTITSREGGVELERIRFEQLVDRASTVGTVWLGLTVGCAQCHDHKYDPLTQKDFYRLMAYFENSDEVDLESPLPGEWGVYRQYENEFRKQRDELLQQYQIAPTLAFWEDGVRDALAHPGKRPNWDVSYDSYSKSVDHGTRILLKKTSDRTARENDALVDYFVRSSSGAIGKEKYDSLKLKELGEKLKKLDERYPRLSTVMTLAENDDRKATHVRIRGNWADRGEQVTPGVPGSLPPAMHDGDRLALAQWLVARENPLPARVAVNRLWQEVFGRGLVRTSEDFGMQGEPPTHPELLDWLASEFIDIGWSIKKMVRLMVTSATYRQSSHARKDLSAVDPGNALLGRQSRFRLPAELIRDAALRSSGLLNDTVGGESIRPPQPEGVADLQYSMKWEETKDRTKYRRGLYVFVQRTANYPLLMNFDAPDRTVTCARREVSNTPLQSLNLMNDPVFVEAAQALAARVLMKPKAERIAYLFRLCYSRDPSSRERDLLLSYLATRGDEQAGWFGASRSLLNSDEFITRE